MSSGPTCDFLFPDRETDVQAERLEMLRKTFSVFGPGTSVDCAAKGPSVTCYTVQFPPVYKAVKSVLPDDFDPHTFTGTAASVKNITVGHPFSSRVVLVEGRGQTVYDLRHTRAEFDPVSGTAATDGGWPLSIMSMNTDIVDANETVFDRDDYEGHATSPRPTQTLMLEFIVDSVPYKETFESFAGPLATSKIDEVAPGGKPESSGKTHPFRSRLREFKTRMRNI